MVLQALLNPRLFTIKKSLDLVTGNFLLQVVTLLSDLSSDIEPSGLFQWFFVQIRNTPLKLFDETSIVFPICYDEVHVS